MKLYWMHGSKVDMTSLHKGEGTINVFFWSILSDPEEFLLRKSCIIIMFPLCLMRLPFPVWTIVFVIRECLDT